MGNDKYYGDPYLDESWFQLDLSIPEDDKVVFIQSCGDLFGEWVPHRWIERILARLWAFPRETFLLQTKNPARFREFDIPTNCILGTTIETNRFYAGTNAPNSSARYVAMRELSNDNPRMVSIEPVMDFDIDLLDWIRTIEPQFVSVGANSGKTVLPEPTQIKLHLLLTELEMFTEVRRKDNLNRLSEAEG